MISLEEIILSITSTKSSYTTTSSKSKLGKNAGALFFNAGNL